ncbi:ABC transporter permease [Inquilinus limosus]|uniref:ABC transporter permease n=1 Tax=Inquilinus limosus TaxID=171674 RepID=UPI003F14D72A
MIETTEPRPIDQPRGAPSPLRRLAAIRPAYWVLIVLLVAIAVTSPAFLEPQGYMNFLRRAAPLVILAAGQLFVIIAGGFDLSVGSLITLVVMASALLIQGDPAQTWWVIALVYGIGLVVGLFNGLVVSWLKVPSIITTLGMLLSLKGIALAWSGGSPQGYLPDNFRDFGRLTWRGLPVIDLLPLAVVVMVVAVALLWWLMHGTVLGRLLHAIGDNPRAAELAGARVRLVRTIAFVVSALSAVTAGILLGGFAGVSTNVGDGYELQAIAAIVIGGAQLLGGRGTVPGAVAGALSLAALFTLLNLIGLPKPLRDAAQGLILIAAVGWSVWRRRRGGA